LTPDDRPSYKDDEPNTYMKLQTTMKKTPDLIRLAAAMAATAVVVYVLADHSDVILDWIIELFDNPNF
jgi:hypothetical protein